MTLTPITSPDCAKSVIGGCLTSATDPLHCIYCGEIVQHARTRLALAIDELTPPAREWWRSPRRRDSA